jgi:hypothetical protein
MTLLVTSRRWPVVALRIVALPDESTSNLPPPMSIEPAVMLPRFALMAARLALH